MKDQVYTDDAKERVFSSKKKKIHMKVYVYSTLYWLFVSTPVSCWSSGFHQEIRGLPAEEVEAGVVRPWPQPSTWRPRPPKATNLETLASCC